MKASKIKVSNVVKKEKEEVKLPLYFLHGNNSLYAIAKNLNHTYSMLSMDNGSIQAQFSNTDTLKEIVEKVESYFKDNMVWVDLDITAKQV